MRLHDYLDEKKDHIIKKMPLLSSDEKTQLINFFKKKTNLEAKIDWNKWKKLTFDDFAEVMKDTTSAKKKRAKVQRHKGISGLKEGEDYIHVKTKNKQFLVYIPLHYKANQIIFSSHIGNCTHQGCIGSSNAQQYYRSEAQAKGKIPVVIVGNDEKYTVMVNKNNKTWDLWYDTNQQDDMTHGEGIPNFSIKKELFTSSLKKMYDDIRIKIWDSDSIVDEQAYDDAVSDYEGLANEIEQYVSDMESGRDQMYDDTMEVIDDTIEQYKDWAKEAEEEAKEEAKEEGASDPNFVPDNLMNKRKEIVSIMKAEPKGTGTDMFGDTVWNLRGVDYTKQELESIMKVTAQDAAKKYLTRKDPKPVDYTERDKFRDIAKKLQGIRDDEWYEVFPESRGPMDKWLDDVEWKGYLAFSEYEFEQGMYPPSPSRYSDYFDFAHVHLGTEGDGDDLMVDISELVHQGGADGQQFLADNDYPHPDTGDFNF